MASQGILLSGGMDSVALSYWLRPQVALTVDYGQKAAQAEIAAAAKISEQLSMEHHIVRVDCAHLGSGDLAGLMPVDLAPKSDWWPFRNQLLLTLCGMAAIQLGISRLLVGSVKSDNYHKDGNSEFYRLINHLVSYQEGGITVEAPALPFSTAELISKSGISMDLLLWAHSCHKSNIPCGDCRGCNKYFSVLEELNDVFHNIEIAPAEDRS